MIYAHKGTGSGGHARLGIGLFAGASFICDLGGIVWGSAFAKA